MKLNTLIKQIGLLIIINCLFVTFSKSQESQINFKYYSTEEGLPNRTVHYITQDSIGYIWLATAKGIARFDGYNFINYTQENGLRSNDIKSVHTVSKDLLWIVYNGFEKNGIDVFDVKTATTTPFSIYYKSKLPRNLLLETDRVVQGINKHFFIGLDTRGYISYCNNTFKYINNNCKLLLLKTDTDNNIYAFDRLKKSIIKLNETKLNIQNKSELLPTNELLYKLNFIFSHDYFRFSESINTTINKSNKNLHTSLKNIGTDFCSIFSQDKKYFINDYVIYNSITGTQILDFKKINNQLVSASNPIQSIFNDSSGTIWIGFEFGLLQIKFVPKKFNTILNNIQVLNKNISVRGITENSKKQLIVNTENLTQYVLNKSQNYEILKSNKVSEYILAICRDSLENVFFHNLKSNAKAIYKIDNNQKLAVATKVNFDDWVWSLSCINNNEIWAGTQSNGIFKIDLKTKTTTPITYNGFTELSKALIYQINKINDSEIWIASDKGLYKATKENGIVERYFNEANSKFYLPSNNISFIEKDKDIVWITSLDKGLIELNLNSKKYTVYSKEAGLPTQTIYAAYKDANNNLWLPSDKGIIQFDINKKEVSRIYTTKDGISQAEFNRISHYRTRDSMLVFGGLNGITYFNPKNFYKTNNTYKPSLIINDAKIYNGTSGNFIAIKDKIDNGKEIELNASDRFISIQLTLLTFNEVENIQYAYKIDDNPNWIIQNNRNIQIAGLGWGKHTITLKAKDENGVWVDNVITVSIKQLKPFFLQTWFLITFFILISLVFIVLYKLRVRQIEKQKIVLEKQVDERTVELINSKNELSILLQQKEILLKEIHHRVKNNLTVIGGLLELQSDNTNDEIVKATLLEATNRVRSIALIHQKLYQHKNFASIEFHEFVNDLYYQIASIMSINKKAIHFDNNINDVQIDIDTSIPLGLILNELITNTFKYAINDIDMPSITINLSKYDNDMYELIYIDNGQGLPTNFDIQKTNTLGISLINLLAKQLSGYFEYNRLNELSHFKITFKNLLK